MGQHKHRVIEKNGQVGVCRFCGPVTLLPRAGRMVCPNAVAGYRARSREVYVPAPKPAPQPAGTRACGHCGADISAKHPDARYCSKAHQKYASARRRRAASAPEREALAAEARAVREGVTEAHVEALRLRPCEECGKPVGHTRHLAPVYCCSLCRERVRDRDFARQYGSQHYHRHRKDSCERCGFVPEVREQLAVHHADENRKNNDPSNLMTLCHNCHALIHARLRRAA
jgi:hypothetical protein